MRQDPRRIASLRHFYAGHIAEFITEYGQTTDPRLIAKGLPAQIPFVLFPRQVELVHFMLDCWRNGTSGTVVKSRDIGGSYVSMAVLGSLCLFHDNFIAGVGSQKEEKCDLSGSPTTLMHKLREFMGSIPPEFSDGWNIDKNSMHMRVSFNNGSAVIAEAGDQIGRGARFAMFVLDEAAFVERPALIDASLSAAVICRLDISSVNGSANSFFERCHTAAIPNFIFHWRDDPRKDDTWYAKQVATLDPVVVAGEIDMDWHASTRGAIIQSSDIQASIDLHLKLQGFKVSGKHVAALDVADEGKDRNALAIRFGQLLQSVESWSGKGADLYATTQKSFAICDEHGLTDLLYDADGLGAGIRGDARVVNSHRTELDPETQRPKGHAITVLEYRGSAAVAFPKRKVPRTNRTNEDMFLNAKAQAVFNLARRFRESGKAARGEPYDPELIICIDSKIPELSRLVAELGQYSSKETASGKLQVNKLGDEPGAKSPNLADAVVMAFAPRRGPLRFTDDDIAAMLA
jgi:hypothetical protein